MGTITDIGPMSPLRAGWFAVRVQCRRSSPSHGSG